MLSKVRKKKQKKKILILDSIFNGVPPKCKRCGGLVKPDIVFFGESLPKKFFDLMKEVKKKKKKIFPSH